MRQNGLRAVDNPSELLLSQSHSGMSGIATAVAIEGARPKVMSSASESNCMPNGEGTFSQRAEAPSKKSKMAPAIIKANVKRNCSWVAIYTATDPHKRFAQVSEFGMIRLICI